MSRARPAVQQQQQHDTATVQQYNTAQHSTCTCTAAAHQHSTATRLVTLLLHCNAQHGLAVPHSALLTSHLATPSTYRSFYSQAKKHAELARAKVMTEHPGMSEGEASELAAAIAVCDDMVARPSLLGDAGMSRTNAMPDSDTARTLHHTTPECHDRQ